MNRTLVTLAACALTAAVAASVEAQPLGEVHAKTKQDQAQLAAHRKEIERLLEVTGAAQMGVQAATMISGQILDGLRQNPAVPARAIDVAKQVLDEEFTKAFAAPDGLMARIVDIYAKHFTPDDVNGLLAFYGTELGRKLVSVMPALMQESMAAAQQWAERETPRIGRALDDRLRKEGLIK
jgi:hypothetical protein